MADAVKTKLLFVDDDVRILDGFKRQLRTKYDIETAVDAAGAFDLIAKAQKPFPVIISDMRMPGMNGIHFLNEVKKRSPDTIRLMLTGNADQDTAVNAVNQSNIFRFLMKPCSPADLEKGIEDAVAQYLLVTAEKDLLQNTLSGSVKLLTDMLSLIDPISFGSALKHREIIRKIAPSLELHQPWDIELAAMLSSIGLVTVPSTVMTKLRKNHPLLQQEKEMLRKVPQIGFDLLKNIPRLEKVAKLVLYQSKNFDGSGFPEDKLAGEAIPIGARVLKVLRDFADLQNQGIGTDAALQKLAMRQGSYDPRVLELFTKACTNSEIRMGEKETKVYEISSSQLMFGQTLYSPVETIDGVLLISAGTTINETLLARLRNYARSPGLKEPIIVDSLMPTQQEKP